MNITMNPSSPVFRIEGMQSSQGIFGNLAKVSNPYQNPTVQKISAMLNSRADTVEISKEAFELQLRDLEREQATTNASDFGGVLKAIDMTIEDLPQYLDAVEYHVNRLNDPSLSEEEHLLAREGIESFSQAINVIGSLTSNDSLDHFTANGSGIVKTAAEKSGIDFNGFQLSTADLGLDNLHELSGEEALSRIEAARESVSNQQSIMKSIIPNYERMVAQEELQVEKVEPQKVEEMKQMNEHLFMMLDQSLLSLFEVKPEEPVEESEQANEERPVEVKVKEAPTPIEQKKAQD